MDQLNALVNNRDQRADGGFCSWVRSFIAAWCSSSKRLFDWLNWCISSWQCKLPSDLANTAQSLGWFICRVICLHFWLQPSTPSKPSRSSTLPALYYHLSLSFHRLLFLSFFSDLPLNLIVEMTDRYSNYISNVSLIKIVVFWLCCIIQVGRIDEIQLMWFKSRYTNKEDVDFGSKTKNINRYIYVKLGTARAETKSWIFHPITINQPFILKIKYS